jgi:anti-anti-sigma regulatory factor
VRAHGVLDGVAGLGISDHVCWEYSSESEFLDAALPWIADGLSLGQRVLYIADKSEHWMADDLSALGGTALRARDRGALVIQPLADLVPDGGPVNPESHLAKFDAITQQALSDGYEGVRVLADVAALVRNPEWRSEHVRWEQLADRYMVDNPLAAFCAYDRRLLDEDATAAIACVHPLRRGRTTGSTFSLFATKDGLFLEGDVDTFQADLLDRTLAARARRDELVVRIDERAFLDAAATTVLARHAKLARERGQRVHIDHGNETVRRVWDLLGYSEIVPIT